VQLRSALTCTWCKTRRICCGKFTKMKPAEITQPDLTKYLAYCFTMLESPLLATPKWQPFQSLLLKLTKSMQPYLEYLKKHAVTQSLHQQRETPSPHFQDDVTMRILPHVPSATAQALRKETKTCSNLQLKFYEGVTGCFQGTIRQRTVHSL
jgi:hypothetical protein